MSKPGIAIGFGALALLALVTAGALMLGGTTPAPPTPETGAPPVAAGPSPAFESPPPPETPPAPEVATKEESSGRAPSVPDLAARRTAEAHGRVVMKGTGEPVAAATISVRTGKNEIDYPETVARLGGEEGMRQLRESGAFAARLSAVGGWKPAHRGESAADGTFAIAVPPDLPKFQFRVAADFAAYRDREAWFTVESAREGVTLELEPAGGIVGTVTDSAGKQVGGARVGLLRQPFDRRDWPEPVETDGSGRYVFRGAPVGRYEAAAVSPGNGPAEREGIEVRAKETTEADFVLLFESFLPGVVVDEAGEGVEGASVTAFFTAGRGGPNALNFLGYGHAQSGPAGSFRVGSLRSGPHRVMVRREGMLSAEERAVEVPAAGSGPSLRFVLGKGRFLAGRVLDAEGRPIAGARVSADSDWMSPKARRASPVYSRQSGKSGEDGSFRLTGLSDGSQVVEAEVEGKGKVEMREVEPDKEGLEIVFSGPTGVAGIVREAETGKPVPRFTLKGMRVTRQGAFATSSEGLPDRTFEKEDGTFDRLDLKPGEHEFTFEAKGFVPERLQEIEVKSGEVRRDIEVKLRRGATVRGKVFERDSGAPVADARIERVEEEGRFNVRRFSLGWGEGPRSAADGAFEIDGLEPGKFRLRADHEAFVEATSEEIEARSGETVEGILISLSRGGAVDGFAVGERGRPILGGQVRVMAAEFRTRQKQGPIDETGYFKVEGLAPGKYQVSAETPWDGSEASREASERNTLRASVLVEEGRTTRVEFPGPPRGGCLVRGRVLRGSAPVEGASVQVLPKRMIGEGEAAIESFADRLHATTKADGSYAIEHVPPGDAVFSVHSMNEGASSASRQRSVTIPDASEFVFDVHLSGGEIAGRVVSASDGEPLSEVGVRVFPAEISSRNALGSRQAWAQTDKEGRYRIRDLEAGTYRIHVDPQPFGAETRKEGEPLAGETRGPVEVAEGREVVADFSLGSGGTAEVTVLDPSGKPVPEAFLSVVPSEGAKGFGRYLEGARGRTGSNGVARVTGLAPGVYYATVHLSGYAAADSEEAEVRVGEKTSFRIQLREGTRVRVKVLDEKDSPVAPAVPFLTDSRGRESFAVPGGFGRETKPGEEGMAIAVLLPGDYTLKVGAEGFREKSSALRVGASSPQDVVVRLEKEEKPK